MKSGRVLVALTFVLVPMATFGYETDTHAFISSHAYDRSTLATPELANRLGLDRFDDELPGERQPFRVPDYIDYDGQRDSYLDYRQVDWNGTFPLPTRRATQLYDSVNMYSGPGEAYRGSSVPAVLGPDHLRTKAWLMRGAIREDDLSTLFFTLFSQPPYPDTDPHGDITRVFRHFYDPVRDLPLVVAGLCVSGDCSKNPDWAFGQTDVAGSAPQPPNSARRNHFTWADAREAQWCALTRNVGAPSPIANPDQNAADRRLCWATAIKSLGHVLHLLQDMAQPQHVRNDVHAPLVTRPTRQSYEQWTNFRAVEERGATVPSDARLRFLAMVGAIPSTAIVTGPSYSIPSFSRAVHYFTTRQVETGIDAASLQARRGLADFANRTFFSEGSILSPDYTLPASDPLSPTFEAVDRVVESDAGQGQLIERVLLSPVVDPIRGGYVDAGLASFNGKVPVAIFGLWADFDNGPTRGIYQTLSLGQQSVHADVLIPRAIAYSAGLIDYFFRGKLEITAPLDGLFSVIDHATSHTVGANGYPFRSDNGNVYGFTKLRLRVRNATPEVNESGITPSAVVPRNILSTVTPGGPDVPTMRAVARYHRNPCYRPDLSGERRVNFASVISEPTGCTAGQRTSFQEISVSLAVPSSAAQMNGAGQDLVFDFSQQPIPVNATDLVVQVVYRGPLGLEDDAIAVGSFDLREPTYLTLWNNTDYAGCSGAWAAHGSTPPGCITEGSGALRSILITRMCIGTQVVYEHLQNPHGNLLVGDYVRVVALLDGSSKATRSRSVVLNLSETEIRNRTITGHVRQSSEELPTVAAPFISDPFWIKRGYVGSFRPLPYYQINGTDPQPGNDMGPLDVGALTNPITVPPAPDPGSISFPDVALSSMGCTMATNQAVFADEVGH